MSKKKHTFAFIMQEISNTASSCSSSTRLFNIDWLRYLLAVTVLLVHFNYLSGVHLFWPIRGGSAVGVFFGLSGFLVCGSYLHQPQLKDYLRNRVRRILPPYIFIVVLCTIGLAFVSELPPAEYFGSGQTWCYLGSNAIFLNFLQPTLPGVFVDSVEPAVNASLWTLKVEWMLYLSIPVFYWLQKRFHWRALPFALTLCLLSVVYSQLMEYFYHKSGQKLFHILSWQFAGQMIYFYSGVIFYHCLDFFRTRRLWVATISTASIVLINLFGERIGSSPFSVPVYEIIYPAMLISFFLCICVYLPQVGRKTINIVGNCSYEMYLFHFPIIQLWMQTGLQNRLPSVLAFVILLTLIFLSSWLFCRFYHAIHYKKA